MPVTGSSVFYTCSGSVFDDGGMVNPYSCNVNNSILVVYSDTMQPGSKLSVTGNYALEENVDFLYIYEGADTNGLLLYTCTGIGSLPPLYSMAGPFTLKFYTNDINCEESGFNLFFTCSSCPSVPNVSLSDVTSTSAVVAWGAIPGSSYELVCVTPNVSPYEVQPIPVNDTFYTVTGLNVNSHYRVYVRTVCGTSDYSPFNQATIITTQIPADIPYTCDFENGAINSEWTFLASSSVNRWCVGSAINNTPGGDSALYITNDHLLTYAYSPNSPTVVWAYRDIHFTSYEEYLLSFDWQCGGDQFYNIGMDVFIGDPAFVKALPVNSTDVPAGAVLLLSARNAQNWTPFQ
ncbi:MAG: fibronectin type III domain-containing protein, partial [Bacteroidales bacterium]